MNNQNKTMTGHPCFSAHAAQKHARVHLPVARQCNIQCNYCNRKYDCVNESRPGVTSAILSPKQALAYLNLYVEKHAVPDVVGIAGPGEAFADPQSTIETLQLVRQFYPEVFLCVATNGLECADYIEDLVALGLSHLTITVNTFDPAVAARLYAWVRFKKHIYRGIEAGECLISRQMEAINKCKQLGVMLKVNAIVVPGVNDHDIENTAKICGELGAFVMNCMPLLPVAGSAFSHLVKPDHELMQTVRWNSAKHIGIVSHCARCRADAAGIIGKDNPQETAELLAVAQKLSLTCDEKRTRIAVATREGLLVNQHLGSATQLEIYSCDNGVVSLHSERSVPAAGTGDERWHELAQILWDCRALLVYRAGSAPRNVLETQGIQLYETEGSIYELVALAFNGKPLPLHPEPLKCGQGCGGTGGGCG